MGRAAGASDNIRWDAYQGCSSRPAIAVRGAPLERERVHVVGRAQRHQLVSRITLLRHIAWWSGEAEYVQSHVGKGPVTVICRLGHCDQSTSQSEGNDGSSDED